MRGMLLAAGLVIYLILSYSYFYSFIKIKSLPNPNQGSYTFSSGAKKTITLVTLGDSLTAGVGASEFSKTYPYLLAEDLASKGSQVKLINLGVPGATIQN